MKSLITKKALAVLLATTAFSVVANATPIDLSKTNIAQGSFNYEYSFTIDAGFTATLQGLIGSSYLKNVSGTGLSGVNITDILVSSGTLLEIPDEYYTPAGPFTSVTDSYKFGGVLSSGTYTLNVLGNAYSTSVASNNFSGGLSIVTSPVPEPETNALMLVGLGLIGFIARRKFS